MTWKCVWKLVLLYCGISLVQSLSYFRLFATPWTAACQASLSITNSQSLLKLMSIQSVIPANHLILCHPPSSCLQSFPASGSFPMSQFFTSGGQSTRVSAFASVLPVNIQDWFPLGWTGWISLQSKVLSRVFSNTTVQKHQFFGSQLSLWSNYCWIQIYDNFYRSSYGRKNFQNVSIYNTSMKYLLKSRVTWKFFSLIEIVFLTMKVW